MVATMMPPAAAMTATRTDASALMIVFVRLPVAPELCPLLMRSPFESDLTTEGVSLPLNSLPRRRVALVANDCQHEPLMLGCDLDPVTTIEPKLLQPHARHAD